MEADIEKFLTKKKYYRRYMILPGIYSVTVKNSYISNYMLQLQDH
jgi:hypothetical protein